MSVEVRHSCGIPFNKTVHFWEVEFLMATHSCLDSVKSKDAENQLLSNADGFNKKGRLDGREFISVRLA